MKKNYFKFSGMLIVAGIFMYGVMYLNTYAWDHIFFSEMRLYMTILSTSVMVLWLC